MSESPMLPVSISIPYHTGRPIGLSLPDLVTELTMFAIYQDELRRSAERLKQAHPASHFSTRRHVALTSHPTAATIFAVTALLSIMNVP
jgi:hypothetical protein